MQTNTFWKLCLIALVAILCLAYAPEPAMSATKTIVATVDTTKLSAPISKYEFGMFIEHIGSLIYRSLWSEMLDDRKFYYPITSRAPESARPAPGRRFRMMMPRKWRPVGPDGVVVMDKNQPFVGDQNPESSSIPLPRTESGNQGLSW